MGQGRMIGYSRSLNESKIESGLGGTQADFLLWTGFPPSFLTNGPVAKDSVETEVTLQEVGGGQSLLPNAIMVSREETSNCRCHQDSKLLPPPISMPTKAGNAQAS